ncbi:MAG TPA: hypothetical protein VL914_11680 [Vicinamibacterales bacterium]|nr:hypothetical protein [Vicinamibacterales bacterium]
MRYCYATCALLYALFMAVPALAQTPAAQPADELVPPPSWAYNDLACAPSIQTGKGAPADENPLRVIGSQDSAVKDLLGPPDVIVVSGGSNAGLQTGQRYFVRRLTRSHADEDLPATIHTAGWIQIMGVDTSVATANIVHACDGILLDDYLDPFVEPRIAAKPFSGAVPQYENMGHIVTGVEGLHTGGTGNLMVIDRGTTDNIAVGQRFLIFRQKRDDIIELAGKSAAFVAASKEPPLVEIGQALVVSARPNDATVQITVAKTAITTGDLVAPIR